MSIIYAGGAYVLPDYDALITPTPPPPPFMPPEVSDPVYTELGAPATIMYGDSAVLKNNNNPLHAYIRYPQAGNPTDEVIYQWAFELFGELAVRFNTGVELSPQDFGEMNVHFDSYVIDNRYAGIHQHGEYTFSATESPREVVKTFNIDMMNFELLEPGDILNLEEPEFVLSLLSLRLLVEHPGTDGYHTFMDESWLTHLLIAPYGIIVFLPQGEFLPDRFDTLTVTLPYEDLGTSLLIRRDAPLPDMPTYTPEAELPPMPTPTPDPDDGADPDGGTDSDAGDPDDGNDPDGTDPDDSAPDDDAGSDGGTGDDLPPEVPVQSGPIDPGRPIIALTFDDGPSHYTDELLDLLEEYGVRATFFTIGNIAHTRSETLRRAVELGSEVAGHSWNHKNLAKMSADDVRLQLEATQSAIEAITGVPSPVFRPPYGAVSDTMKTVAEELGLSIVNWNANVDPEDWRNKDSEQIYEFVMENISNQAILLSHDVYESTLEAYRRIIPELLLQGYQIVTVTELLELTNGELTPGFAYHTGQKAEVLT